MAASRCPRCNAEIPAGAPEGLCPRCLLQSSETGPYVPKSGFTAPTIESLQAAFPQLQILELLGHGGMGAVYKARQPMLDRLVAVKILPPELGKDPAFVERFLREARALAKLNHPNIVGVHDFGQAGGYCYFVMEYLDGVNLRQAIRTGQLKPAETLKIVPQVCEALQFAHDEGVVHRDIKPENILLDKRGRVKIADFGLAKLLGLSASDLSLTNTRQALGTIRYMAPEQLEGSRDVDHRADIYSLGVTFYEMLTGELPLGRFAPPSKKVQIDVRLDDVVLRTLEKEPELRYQQASDVKTEVEAIAGSVAIGVETRPAADRTAVWRELRKVADSLTVWAVICGLTWAGIFIWKRIIGDVSQISLTQLMYVNWTLFFFVIAIGITAALLRRRRNWVLTLSCTLALLGPAVFTLFLLVEYGRESWSSAFFAFWIGVPVVLWIIATLFREDVRAEFEMPRPPEPPIRWLRAAVAAIAIAGLALTMTPWLQMKTLGTNPALVTFSVFDSIGGIVVVGLLLAILALNVYQARQCDYWSPVVTMVLGCLVFMAVAYILSRREQSFNTGIKQTGSMEMTLAGSLAIGIPIGIVSLALIECALLGWRRWQSMKLSTSVSDSSDGHGLFTRPIESPGKSTSTIPAAPAVIPWSRRVNPLIVLRLVTLAVAVAGVATVLATWRMISLSSSKLHSLPATVIDFWGIDSEAGQIAAGLAAAVFFLVLATIMKRWRMVPVATFVAGVGMIVAVEQYLQHLPVNRNPSLAKYAAKVRAIKPPDAIEVFGTGIQLPLPLLIESYTDLQMVEYAEKYFGVESQRVPCHMPYYCALAALLLMFLAVLDLLLQARERRVAKVTV